MEWNRMELDVMRVMCIVNGHNVTQCDTVALRLEISRNSPSVLVSAEQPVATHKLQAVFALTVDA